jgi:hypothetical protein
LLRRTAKASRDKSPLVIAARSTPRRFRATNTPAIVRFVPEQNPRGKLSDSSRHAWPASEEETHEALR